VCICINYILESFVSFCRFQVRPNTGFILQLYRYGEKLKEEWKQKGINMVELNFSFNEYSGLPRVLVNV
jgi:hypothetical protein